MAPVASAAARTGRSVNVDASTEPSITPSMSFDNARVDNERVVVEERRR